MKPMLKKCIAASSLVVALAWVAVGRPARAGTSGPVYDPVQTYMVRWEFWRVSAVLVRCRGTCRSAPADGSRVKHFAVPVRTAVQDPPWKEGGTLGACLTVISADCTDANAAATTDEQQ